MAPTTAAAANAADGGYDGEWLDGKKHGAGKMTFDNGCVYQGQWRDGKPSGRSKYSYGASGDWYEGGFKDGKRSIGTFI